MPIRVLHVIDHLGYAGRQLPIPLNIVDRLNDDEFNAVACALRGNPERTMADGRILTLGYTKWDPRAPLGLLKLCKKLRIDILHAHLPKSIFACVIVGGLRKTPVIIHEHGSILRGNPTILFTKMFRHRIARAVAASEAVAGILVKGAKVDENNVEVVHTPIDFAAFDCNHISRTRARDRIGIPQDRAVVIGFLGRLHRVKGVDLLIKAAAKLLEKSDDYFLVVAGDGPERERLENLAAALGITNRVKFLGQREDVAEVIAAFDVGAMPSRHEALGRSAVEMMRMKVPVVASGVDGLAELIRDGDTGIVTKENTPAGICSAVERLMNDDNLRKAVVENGYRFSEQFAIEKHVEKLKKIYREVAEQVKK